MGVLEQLIGKPLHEATDEELKRIIEGARKAFSSEKKPKKEEVSLFEVLSLAEDLDLDLDLED